MTCADEMAEHDAFECELEIERRFFAELPPSTYATKDRMMERIRRCQAAIAAAQARK